MEGEMGIDHEYQSPEVQFQYSIGEHQHSFEDDIIFEGSSVIFGLDIIWKSGLFPGYGCDVCQCFTYRPYDELEPEIYEAYDEVEQYIEHPSHPAHPLTLMYANDGSQRVCNGCGFKLNDADLTYQCVACEFLLHLDCASLMPNIEYEGHDHLLNLVEKMPNESRECQKCGFQIAGTSFLRCAQCKINFHVQCDFHPLPPTIVHKHHQHPLTLVNETPAKDDSDLHHCAACKEEMDPEHPFYFCDGCGFFIHVRCVVIEIKFDKLNPIKHFSHDHFLTPTERNDDVSCYACGKGIQGTAYGCQSCMMYLHKFCTELPTKRHHPFHEHPLTLRESYSGKPRECNACHKFSYDFTYSCCYDCGFNLDLDCISLQPSIKYEGDEKHLLTFFERLRYAPQCRACKSSTPPEASYLRCVICDFNIHFTCSPLPETLNHWSHELHPLTLHNRFVDENYDVQICDICETKRDPRDCVYICAECDFIVGLDCVISEVIHCVQGECRDVKWKILVRKEEDQKVVILQDILDSYAEEERQKMEDIHSKLREYVNTISEGGTSSGAEANNIDNPDSHIARFIEDGLAEIPIEPSFIDKEDEVVEVGDYMITRKLASVLRHLLDKHKDFNANRISATKSEKTFFLVVFCGAVQNMCETKVMDASDSLICSWWYNFKYVQLAGFKIDFALSHLLEIEHTRRRIDMQVNSNHPLHEPNMEMAQTFERIDELYKLIDKLNEEVGKIRSKKLDTISSYRYEVSKLEAERLDKAFEIMMNRAGTRLLWHGTSRNY